MSDLKLGTTPTEDAQRDAIHIAVAPIVAGTGLFAGQHVVLENGVAIAGVQGAIGIVDPFRIAPVQKGERFWLCLYQGTIVGMRHHWIHPAFSDVPPNASRAPVSEAWLRHFAARHGFDYPQMLEQARSGDLCFGDTDYPMDTATAEVFFAHFNAVTGSNIENGYFRCAC